MTIINPEEPQLLMRSTALTKRRQLSLISLLVGTGNAARLGHSGGWAIYYAIGTCRLAKTNCTAWRKSKWGGTTMLKPYSLCLLLSDEAAARTALTTIDSGACR